MAHALMLKGETRRVQLYDDHTFATLAHRPPLAARRDHSDPERHATNLDDRIADLKERGSARPRRPQHVA